MEQAALENPAFRLSTPTLLAVLYIAHILGYSQATDSHNIFMSRIADIAFITAGVGHVYPQLAHIGLLVRR